MFPACYRKPRSGAPMKMSYTRVILGVLVVYVAHTCWAIYGFIYTKPCDGAKADRCVTSYLSAKPRLQLSVYCALDVIDEAGYTLLFKVDIVDVNNDFERNVSVALHEMMLKEGSAYAIVFVHKNGVLPWKDSKHVRLVARLTSQTTPIQPAEATTRAGQTIPVAKEIHTVSYWRSRLSLKVMNEDFLFNIAAVPSDLWRYMKIVEDEKQEKKKVYLPLLLVDEIRSRLIDFVEINSSTRAVPLTVAYNTISLGKFRIWIHIQAVLYSLRHFGFSEQNLDEIKALFVESGLHVLAVFMLVPAFHLSFEIFAFKNDIKFWKGNKSLAGISRRSVLWRCFSTFVIFLHLLEEGSGWLILLPTGISALIELWKINKIMGLSSKAQVEKVGESVRETEVYDSAAMKFLSYLMYPLCISGAMYSYFYLQNKR